MTIRQRRAIVAFSAISFFTLATSSAQAQFRIELRANETLVGNQAALDAFNRAASQWTARITDPTTIYIDAQLASLDPGVLGDTNAVSLFTTYDSLRNAMIADSALDVDDGIVASLPTAANFNAALPPGFTLATNSQGNKIASTTKANFKALNYTGLDERFGQIDGTIRFSTNFAFDYDNRDGVGAGLFDFETIAAHEIGHLLGFISSVDTVDGLLAAGQTGAIAPTTLDFFRFQNGSANDPSSAAQFATAERSLLTGGDAIFDDTFSEYRLSTGVRTGDGRQASHWKDNDINNGTLIGIMDPTFPPQQIIPVDDADFRAMDLIGYNIVATPEPSGTALLLPALTGLWVVRVRRRAARTPRTKSTTD